MKDKSLADFGAEIAAIIDNLGGLTALRDLVLEQRGFIRFLMTELEANGTAVKAATEALDSDDVDAARTILAARAAALPGKHQVTN